MDSILTESDMAGIFASITEIDKAQSYEIKLDFTNRFRIWTEQILPERRQEIKRENTVEYIKRMRKLFSDDIDRLSRRAAKEYKDDDFAERMSDLGDILISEYNYYYTEINKIKERKNVPNRNTRD